MTEDPLVSQVPRAGGELPARRVHLATASTATRRLPTNLPSQPRAIPRGRKHPRSFYDPRSLNDGAPPPRLHTMLCCSSLNKLKVPLQ